MIKLQPIFFSLLFITLQVYAQQPHVSKAWVADQKNGTYKNPILHADYSDPDVIRVGDDFYMTASSFHAAPGLPILHSKDLVNWNLIAYALPQQLPADHFSAVQHGNGVWAPSIRYHKGEFYIYYPDPDFGIYLTKAKNIQGPWSISVLVEAGKGLIDPCPLWDKDGKAYLVHAYAGSRAGIKSIIVIKPMNAAGTATTGAGRLVYDGHATDPTIEGPKLYQRNGYYYIFAPAGGVSTGWQLVLRAKNIYGPYERKVVMDQGNTNINGPHQGAWVNTTTGEDWFLHFQDKEAYGRVVHLQPMQWKNDWPIIGVDADGDGKGEPVTTYKKPNIGKTYPVQTPPDSDEFNAEVLGLQWQWQANAKATWHFMQPANGTLRLFSDKQPDAAKNLWDVPNLLLQKFPAATFTATVKLKFSPNPKIALERAGLVVMGLDYAGLMLKQEKEQLQLIYVEAKAADKGTVATEKIITTVPHDWVYLRVKVTAGAVCGFSYSIDNIRFNDAGISFTAQPGKWVGAKLGLFCTRATTTNDAGFLDADWFRVTE
ncbi:glycoside hydrolase family 43 protein [Sediminibacterium goheungense]|uniref:Beta-xylosidase n=1 Tax=Sediminibacterium goheungense TaxID=1086393 RepID=A0A4R6J0Q4_9BACT|nr:glycoside hydrolase 43 family protein [Sediminibacterium goheungense]TDO28792.1 beta-xylosidase [Sediminibacterium goheungense]